MTRAGGTIRFRRILVTGGHGFVGRQLVEAVRSALPSDGQLLLAVTGPSSSSTIAETTMNLLDSNRIAEVIKAFRPDLILHLAAQASSAASAVSTAATGETWAVNCGGTLALARAVAAHVPEACFFYVSSAEVYGLSFNDGPARETTSLRPGSVYSRSKAAGEALLNDILPDSARLIIVRPSNHSGLGQDERFVIPAFATQIARIECGLAEPVVKVGNLTPRRDFLDIRDVIEAYMRLIEMADRLPGRITLNVGSGTAIAISEILACLRSAAQVDTVVETDPSRLRDVDVPVAINDPSALMQLSGWKPRYSIFDTIRDVLIEQRRVCAG